MPNASTTRKYPPYVKGGIAQIGAPQGRRQIGRNNNAASRSIPREDSYQPASPGVDGAHVHGSLVSGASTGGFLCSRVFLQRMPDDWRSVNPVWGKGSAGGVGSIFPKAKGANKIRNRMRGISPFAGFFKVSYAGPIRESASGAVTDAVMKPGGTTDMNPGADGLIAGGFLGHMQASSFVRLHGVRADRNMRLPVTPDAALRSGKRINPTGGAQDGGPQAPLLPVAPGLPSIFGFFTQKNQTPLVANPASNTGTCK